MTFQIPSPHDVGFIHQVTAWNPEILSNFSTISEWWNSLSQTEKQQIALYLNRFYTVSTDVFVSLNDEPISLMSENGTSNHITRRWDGALLYGGWNFRTRNSRRDSATGARIGTTERHPTYLAIIDRNEQQLAFEWIKRVPVINSQDRLEECTLEGLEAVFTASIRLAEVTNFLCADLYMQQEYSISLNIGRSMWQQDSVRFNRENQNYAINGPLLHAIFNTTTGRSYAWPAHTVSYGQTWDNAQLNEINMNPATKSSPKRTLLTLLRTVRTKWDDLIINEQAYTWQWVGQSLNTTYAKRWNKIRGSKVFQSNDDPESIAKKFMDDWDNEVLAMLERRTGHPWVKLAEGRIYLPRKMCMGLWMPDAMYDFDSPAPSTQPSGALCWMKRSQFNTHKHESRIIWDPTNKRWTWYSLMATVFTKLEPVTSHVEGQTKLFYKKYDSCQACSRWFAKSLLTYDHDLDTKICAVCDALAKPANEIATYKNCFGQYHSHSRNWTYFYSRTKNESKDAFCAGMEVEMQSTHGSDESYARAASWEILKKQREFFPGENVSYFERDGSLAEGGIEMITNPMSLQYHQQYWSKMLPAIREHCTGWNTEQFNGPIATKNNYGIHMTFSRKWWTDLQLARMIKFVDNPKNQDFIQALAQRRAIYNGPVLAGKDEKLKDKVRVHDKKIIDGVGNRYLPINVKGKLVELRFFRTTLNTESFLKNVEWLFAFHEWAKTTSFSINHIDFLQWLAGSKKNHGQYMNLLGYFNRTKLPCKGGAITNPWRTMLMNTKKEQLSLFPNNETPAMDTIIKEDLECA